MHQLIITVFASSESRFMIKRMLAAWGFPLVCVVVSLCWDAGIYGKRITGDGTSDFQGGICMPHSTVAPATYYTTYLGPICVVMFLNSIVFVLVMRVLCQQTHSSRTHTLSKQTCMKKTLVTKAQVGISLN